MENHNISPKAICLAEIKSNAKLPKNIINRHTEEEISNGIINFGCSVIKERLTDKFATLKITGELIVETKQNTLMCFLVYNGNNELIEASCEETFNKNLSGRKTFSVMLTVPADEYISRIAVRFTPNPVFV